MDKKTKIDGYLDEGNAWEQNYVSDLKHNLKISRYTNMGLLILLIITTVSSIYMALNEEVPLIQIEEVDRVTGHRSLKKLVKAGETLTEDQQITFLKADIRTLINCYEGYTFALINSNLECVAAFSNADVVNQYQRYVDKENTGSPAKLVGNIGAINVDIIESNPLTADKFTVVSHVALTPQRAGKNDKPLRLTITITYKYENIPMDDKTRELNSHGFVATSYQQSFDY